MYPYLHTQYVYARVHIAPRRFQNSRAPSQGGGARGAAASAARRRRLIYKSLLSYFRRDF